MEGDRNEDKVEGMTTHESGEEGMGQEAGSWQKKEEMEKAWIGWEEAGQNLLEYRVQLENPESQQPFAVQNIALKPPFNGIMAFH